MVARVSHIAMTSDTVGRHMPGRRATQSPDCVHEGPYRPFVLLPASATSPYLRLMRIPIHHEIGIHGTPGNRRRI